MNNMYKSPVYELTYSNAEKRFDLSKIDDVLLKREKTKLTLAVPLDDVEVLDTGRLMYMTTITSDELKFNLAKVGFRLIVLSDDKDRTSATIADISQFIDCLPNSLLQQKINKLSMSKNEYILSL